MSLNSLMIKLIKKYQSNTSRLPRCRHIPSCSNYSLECYQKFNFVKATFLTSYRIIRCNPLSRNIYDPVPLSKTEKKRKKYYEELASKIDDELVNIYITDKNNFLDIAIKYIENNYYDISSEESLRLFFARLERLVYLSKKKVIPFKQKEVKNYIYNYVTNKL